MLGMVGEQVEEQRAVHHALVDQQLRQLQFFSLSRLGGQRTPAVTSERAVLARRCSGRQQQLGGWPASGEPPGWLRSVLGADARLHSEPHRSAHVGGPRVRGQQGLQQAVHGRAAAAPPSGAAPLRSKTQLYAGSHHGAHSAETQGRRAACLPDVRLPQAWQRALARTGAQAVIRRRIGRLCGGCGSAVSGRGRGAGLRSNRRQHGLAGPRSFRRLRAAAWRKLLRRVARRSGRRGCVRSSCRPLLERPLERSEPAPSAAWCSAVCRTREPAHVQCSAS